MSTIKSDKQQLREAAKLRRGTVRAEWSATQAPETLIAAHLRAERLAGPGAIVAAYMAIGDEIDAVAVAADAFAQAQLGLPRMHGRGQPLTFHAWSPSDPLAQAKWGILEPLASAPVVQPTVVLVPLLAFDRSGFRLGYGGGFYDRTLAGMRSATPPISIGLAFDELEVDAVPRERYDQRLDYVATPTIVHRCRKD
ncbi:MAG: 5-formyltetrahydrofolate cyclo-ligase [Pseudomonadota bacterium]